MQKFIETGGETLFQSHKFSYMNHTLTQDLIFRFEAIKDDFAGVDNEGTKRSLILKNCEELCSRYDERIAANAMTIIHHYISSGRISVEGLIHFLSLGRELDFQTILREERDGFDKEYGTTTSLILRQYELPEQVSLHRFQTSGRCHPSPVSSVKLALKALGNYNVQYDQYIFIDVGSGLGRNLLLASDYPFKKIIGIEHSQYLYEITKENLVLFQAKKQKTFPFELICTDALEYPFPQENIVFYFWRPFNEELAFEFIKRIESFIQTTEFNVILLVLGQVYAAVKQSKYLNVQDIFFTPDLLDEKDKYFPVSIYSV